MNTYVIFTETGREQHIAELLTNSIISAHPDAAKRIYVPHKAKLIADKDDTGRKFWAEAKEILFPGYAFVESENIELFNSLQHKPQVKTSYTLLGHGAQRLAKGSGTDQASVYLEKRLGNQYTIIAIPKNVTTAPLTAVV